YLAKFWDTSIAGMMATTVGFIFIVTFICQKIVERRKKVLVHKLETS
ncbi:iron ABC transporter, partial [Clostridioides difficile]|nr:iron ABC transporter [Clostridioides difficile]